MLGTSLRPGDPPRGGAEEHRPRVVGHEVGRGAGGREAVVEHRAGERT